MDQPQPNVDCPSCGSANLTHRDGRWEPDSVNAKRFPGYPHWACLDCGWIETRIPKD